MSALDRAIIRATLNGHVKFTDPIAHRFAMVGDLRLCRNLTERWHLVIANIDQVRLSLPAHLALSIASRYAYHGETGRSEVDMPDPDYLKRLADEIEQCLNSRLYGVALAAALSIPDVCGKIDDPSKASKARFVEWFERYVGPYYRAPGWPIRLPEGSLLVSGSDAYALRCAVLHEGSDDVSGQRAARTYSRFILSSDENVNSHGNIFSDLNALNLDVSRFCRDILLGLDHWSEVNIENKAVAIRRADMLKVYKFLFSA